MTFKNDMGNMVMDVKVDETGNEWVIKIKLAKDYHIFIVRKSGFSEWFKF